MKKPPKNRTITIPRGVTRIVIKGNRLEEVASDAKRAVIHLKP